MAINLRQVEIFKPYANELPEQLLVDAGADEAQLAAWLQAPILRVAKLQDELLAAYAMQRDDQQTFALHGVVVEPRRRKQGLGRWLTGHAIGVAESKGGRRLLLVAPTARGQFTRMFTHMGFTRDPSGRMCFDLIPE